MSEKSQDLLKEIRQLNEKYHLVVEGRKEIIKKIRENIKKVRNITPQFNAELDELERYYNYRDYYISDYKVVMSLLLRLANSNEDIYAMKDITTTGYYDTSLNEVNKLYSKILFISDKNLINKMDDHLYYFDEFKLLATKAINKGHSMIIITSNLFEPNVKPRKNDVKCDSIVDIKNGGISGDITCYINSPDLKEAINQFTNYVEINGPDFSNIDEDTLYNLIKKENNFQKKKY